MIILPETLRILIVEDDAEDYQLTRRIVREAVQVRTEFRWAQGLSEALALRTESASDLLLVDYQLTTETGRDVLGAFRERGWVEPAILLTSLDRDTAHTIARQSGADDFISKQDLSSASIERAFLYVLERVRAEAAVRGQAQLHLSLFDDSPFPKIVYDEDTLRILNANRAAMQLYGYSHQELVGKDMSDLAPPGANLAARAAYRALGGREGTISHGRSLHVRSDGRTLQVEITSNALDYAGCRARIGEIVDMTDRLAAEAMLRETEMRFQQSQKMEAIGQLAGGVAHDFNNLLTAIRGYAELVRSDLPEGSESRHDVGEIITAADRAGRLTKQLLAFSRRQVLQPSQLDLGSVVRGMQDMLERIIGEDFELVVVVDDPLRIVRADRGQIEQVILNLVVNARDAMPGGGVVAIHIGNHDLDDEFAATHPGSRAGAFVRMSVTDTGTGMPPDVQRRLFEPFFTTKPEGKGTGLGLPTVYGIVKQSGGYIDVWSLKDVGSRFTVYLPMSEHESVTVEVPEEPQATPTGKATVLVVEDSPAVRVIVRRSLESQGYRVVEACNGEDGLRVLEAGVECIDLIITDLVMPQMSGRAFIESLRSAGHSYPVLVMSGYSDDAAVWRGWELPAGASFIPKPFSVSELIQRVRSLLAAPGPHADTGSAHSGHAH